MIKMSPKNMFMLALNTIFAAHVWVGWWWWVTVFGIALGAWVG